MKETISSDFYVGLRENYTGILKINTVANSSDITDHVTLKEWGSLRDDVFGLKKDYASLHTAVGEMAVAVRSLSVKFDESRKPNWVIVISILGLVFGIFPVMAGGSLWIISGQINQAASPINSRLAQVEIADIERDRKLLEEARTSNDHSRDLSNLIQQNSVSVGDVRRAGDAIAKLNEASAASSVADGVSKTDRAQMNDRLRVVEASTASAISERRGQIGEINARLLEVEQQFHATSNISNMRWAEQNRQNAMTFEKLHPGERYPADGFFPGSIFQSSPNNLVN